MSRTSRAFTRLTSLAITVSLASATLAAPSPTLAAGDKTMLYIDGEPRSVGIGVGDGGKSFVIVDDADYEVMGFHEGQGWDFQAARVLFREAAGVNAPWGTWNARFGAPPDTQMVPGTYTGAVRSTDPGSSEPELDVSGNGEGCNNLTGEFTIHEIEWEVNILHSLSASFRQRCDGNPPRGNTYGEIRFNATTGIKALEARPWSIDFGQAPSGTPLGSQGITVKAIGDRPVDLGAASIAGAGASSFSIASNACSGTTLDPGQSCSINVAATPSTNKVFEAKLRLVDDTYRGHREVPLKVKGTGTVDATADVSTFKFFPVVDQYKDTLAVKGTRSEAVRVDIEISPTGTSNVIAATSGPAASGDYKWIWRGRVDATGELAPAGKYDIVTTLIAGLDTKTVTKTITLSHDWVTWKKKTAVKEGRRIQLWGWDKDGKVTLSKSIYPNGVRLNSGRGFAAVVYALPVTKSDIYGWMSFDVEGKSTNMHKAVVAAWNPSMGGYKDLGHYDAAKKIGPWKKWWKTGVHGQGRVKKGKVRVAVMNWKGLGGAGKSIFDIKRVRVTYKVGTKHAAPGPAVTVPPKPAWVVGPRVEKLAPRRLPVLERAPEYVPPSPPVTPDEPAIAVDDPTPIATPEPEPETPPADDQAPTESPEPEPEPVASPEPEAADPAEGAVEESAAR